MTTIEELHAAYNEALRSPRRNKEETARSRAVAKSLLLRIQNFKPEPTPTIQTTITPSQITNDRVPDVDPQITRPAVDFELPVVGTQTNNIPSALLVGGLLLAALVLIK